MALKIKYPTLITGDLQTHHLQYLQMVSDLTGLITQYQRRGVDDKLQISYRGKTKIKVIEQINYDIYDIGGVPCVSLCIEESKKGQESMYLQRLGNNTPSPIATDDKIGSKNNYALFYPLIDQYQRPVNKWLIIVYVTPGKDDIDMVNTFKNVVNKIFNFPFKYVIPTTINGQQVVPKIDVTLTKLENIDSSHYIAHDYIANSSLKSVQKVTYINIDTEAAEEILHDNDEVNSYTKRVVRIFHSTTNRSAYTTYTTQAEEDGRLNTLVTTKYSEYDEIQTTEQNALYNPQEMKRRFARVLTNYLSNGADGQNAQHNAENG